jgi:hypothetical protein
MTALWSQWLWTGLTLFSALYCTVFTLAACADDWLLLALLLPGCVWLWGCGAFVLVGLLVQTSQKVIHWRLS